MTADAYGDDYLQIFSLSDKSPLEALTSAYAERLRAIHSHAGPGELAQNRVWVAELEALALRAGQPSRRPVEGSAPADESPDGTVTSG